LYVGGVVAVPTKKEVEQKVGRLAELFGKGLFHPHGWIKPLRYLKYNRRGQSGELPEKIGLIYRKRMKELQLYMLEKELIKVGSRIEKLGSNKYPGGIES
jgi:hypothetical protein